MAAVEEVSAASGTVSPDQALFDYSSAHATEIAKMKDGSHENEDFSTTMESSPHGAAR
jgi:hypothetical protein